VSRNAILPVNGLNPVLATTRRCVVSGVTTATCTRASSGTPASPWVNGATMTGSWRCVGRTFLLHEWTLVTSGCGEISVNRLVNDGGSGINSSSHAVTCAPAATTTASSFAA
jgi:hypothetical protein